MMYAVIKAGGHQYRVQKGDKFEIDRQAGEVGDKIQIKDVLMIGGNDGKVGQPFVPGAKVELTIQAQTRAKKIIVFKYKRRKNYKKKRGHKQPLTVVEVTDIHA